MNKLLYLLFAFLFVFDYLLKSISIGKIPGLAPEILSAIIMLVVCVQFARSRAISLPVRYIIFFIFFILFIIIGILINEVQPGAIFAGIRKYFRYAPLFLLPIVYQFNETEIKRLIRVLFIFSVFQLPVVIYQKLVVFKLHPTGDVIEGTILGSGKLAVYLICVISIILAYYLKGFITLRLMLFYILIVFLPIAITEAAASLFLLPIVFIIPLLFVKKDRSQAKRLKSLAVAGVVFFVGFIAIYNAQYSSRWGGNILNAVIEGQVFEKIYRGASNEDSISIRKSGRKMEEISRLDSVILPIEYLYKKGIVFLLCGVGLGNASDSFSELLQGEYYWTIDEKNSDLTTMSNMLWELGIIGIVLSLVFLIMIFFDARRLSHSNNRVGAIAFGWMGVIAVLTMSMMYINFLGHNVIGYLMWFFAGYIVARSNLTSMSSAKVTV
jgi:hypothetical protein